MHPGCWEEIFFIAGDLLMPKRGFGGPGTLLVNPADYPHGPYVSQKGVLLITHAVTPMGTTYEDFPSGPGICQHYIETTPLVENTVSEAWETRPEKAAWEEMTGAS